MIPPSIGLTSRHLRQIGSALVTLVRIRARVSLGSALWLIGLLVGLELHWQFIGHLDGVTMMAIVILLAIDYTVLMSAIIVFLFFYHFDPVHIILVQRVEYDCLLIPMDVFSI